MKSSKFNNKGFTLVELLAVIAILSIVMSVVMYFAMDTVRTTKSKSYQVTISNIENEVASYVVEQNKSFDWIINDGGRTQYQCVTVQDLIDTGYFKGDILNSYVDDKNKVKASNYVYIERDVNTKSITKNILLVGKKANYSGLCNVSQDAFDEEELNVSGSISFIMLDSGWQKKKDVIIKYQMIEYDNLSNYRYDYEFVPGDGSGNTNFNDKNFLNNIESEEVTVNKNGRLIAVIKDKNGNKIREEIFEISMIDNTPPVITCYNDRAKIDQKITGSLITYGLDGVPHESDECAAYITLKDEPGNAIANEEEVLVATDNDSGIAVEKYVWSIINEDNNSIRNLRQKCCNCDDGYCKYIWNLEVTDVAGNSASKDFIYYTKYTYELNYCKLTPPQIPDDVGSCE